MVVSVEFPRLTFRGFEEFWVPTMGPEEGIGELAEAFPQGRSHQCIFIPVPETISQAEVFSKKEKKSLLSGALVEIGDIEVHLTFLCFLPSSIPWVGREKL